MANANVTAPHPLLTSPSLYVADVPDSVKWSHLDRIFKCGFVRSGGKSTLENGRTRWTIMFEDLYHAEMALATLQGAEVPGISPTYRLNLSHASTLSSSLPKDRLFPQYFKGSAQAHEQLSAFTAQDVFKWFRRAGPLVSVRVNAMIGHAYPTCVVEYWNETHARYAWIHCRMMDPALAAFKPSFELHTYNPLTLTCTGFGRLWRQPDLHNAFSPFGQLVEARMIKVGVPDAYGVVSFSTVEEAESALEALNGKIVGAKRISVRYCEPDQQGTFRPAFSTSPGGQDSSKSSWRRTSSSSGTAKSEDPEMPKKPGGPRPCNEPRANGASQDPRLKEAEEAERLAKLEQEAAEAEERVVRAALSAASRVHDTARAVQAEADAAVEEAEKVLLAAKERQLQAAHAVIQGLEMKNEAARRERDAGRRRKAAVENLAAKKAEADEARDAHRQSDDTDWAKRSGTHAYAQPNGEPEWRAHARKRQESMKENQRPQPDTAGNRAKWGFQQNGGSWRARAQSTNGQPAREGPFNGYRETSTRDIDSDEEEEREDKTPSDEQEEHRQREDTKAEEENMREEVERRARLEDSIRKMKLMREQEESDKLTRQEKERLEEERKRKEAERIVTEKQEREEAERLARVRRQKAYEDAAAHEIARCRVRDRKLWNITIHSLASQWTTKQSIHRFQTISIEFDTIKFCDSQPVTFKSIPWPTLSYPAHTKVEHIDWDAVEQFFTAAKSEMGVKEYKSMLEKAHRRFHPDKWRSRGLLNTVLDEELRKRLEDAGNIVAQAITPLWLASKSI